MRPYQDIKREINELEQLAEEMREGEVRDARHRVFAIMREAGISPEALLDIAEKPERKKQGKVAAKYQNAEGETWTGRGRMPKWLQGKNPEDFRIASNQPELHFTSSSAEGTFQ